MPGDQASIFMPFFVLILLTIVVWIVMYARRIPLTLRSGLHPNQLTPQELARISPPGVSNPSDNLKNLFEVPVIFYALALYLYVSGQVDSLYVVLAWIFVGLRVAHSLVHCTFNTILLRFGIYIVSTLTLWAMVARAFIEYLRVGS
jgi:hypothetical protein